MPNPPREVWTTITEDGTHSVVADFDEHDCARVHRDYLAHLLTSAGYMKSGE